MTGPISLEELTFLREIADEPLVLTSAGTLPAGAPHPKVIARLLARKLVRYVDGDDHRLVVTMEGRRMLGE